MHLVLQILLKIEQKFKIFAARPWGSLPVPPDPHPHQGVAGGAAGAAGAGRWRTAAPATASLPQAWAPSYFHPYVGSLIVSLGCPNF